MRAIALERKSGRLCLSLAFLGSLRDCPTLTRGTRAGSPCDAGPLPDFRLWAIPSLSEIESASRTHMMNSPLLFTRPQGGFPLNSGRRAGISSCRSNRPSLSPASSRGARERVQRNRNRRLAEEPSRSEHQERGPRFGENPRGVLKRALDGFGAAGETGVPQDPLPRKPGFLIFPGRTILTKGSDNEV